jgi:cyclopropane-fatty-acyl-phospholipid synthase
LNGNSSNVGAFLSHYIFPGGYLATVNQLLTSIHAGSKGSLEVDGVQSIGPHYIKTLECWRKNFMHNWQTIRSSFISKTPGATADDIEHFRRRWLVSYQSPLGSSSAFHRSILVTNIF